jgi:hypothetical protein
VSVAVTPEQLPGVIAGRRLAYLITTGPEGAKVVAVDVVADTGGLVVTGAGGGSRAHVDDRPGVTLVFPPVDIHDMTLLVDGDATIPGGEDVVVVPRSAVLHRPAPSLR